jgi:hypothetical protein
MSIATDILRKAKLPTTLDSAEIRESIPAEIRRRSFFSATVSEARILSHLQDAASAYARGEISEATAREQMLHYLDQIGYQAEGGGIQDLTGRLRLNLIFDTNRKMAEGARMAAQDSPAEINRYPAWRLTRRGWRQVPRVDWMERWRSAGVSVGWDGAIEPDMVALKGSPIWQALGDGTGGYEDALGNPFPPFAFGSGLDWMDVSRDEAVALGLNPDDAKSIRPSLAPKDNEVNDAIKSLGKDFEKELYDELRA